MFVFGTTYQLVYCCLRITLYAYFSLSSAFKTSETVIATNKTYLILVFILDYCILLFFYCIFGLIVIICSNDTLYKNLFIFITYINDCILTNILNPICIS